MCSDSDVFLYDRLTHLWVSKMKKKPGRPSVAAARLNPRNIEAAIKSTQSMRQAAVYLGVSRNTFKKYAKQYGLYKPQTNLKGIKRLGNVSNLAKYDVKDILEGRSPSPYRDQKLLEKGIHEGYLACQCDNCSAEFTTEKEPPLMLDFLDRDTLNTHRDNLRILCFNCIFLLRTTQRGYYTHRNTPIAWATERAEPQIPTEPQSNTDESDELTYVPFEEFQKTLNN